MADRYRNVRYRWAVPVFCLLVLIGLLLTGCGAEVPEAGNGYVSDEADVLSGTTEDHIAFCNAALERQCGVRAAVLTVSTTDGKTIADYAERVFREWKLGDGDVLLVLAVGDDNYWALQGKDSGLSAGTLGTMLTTYLEPSFAQKQYDAGVCAVYDALIDHYEAYHSVVIGEDGGSFGGFSEYSENTHLLGKIFAAIGNIIYRLLGVAVKLASFAMRLAGGLFGWALRLFSGMLGWILSLSTVGLVIVILIIIAIVRSASGGRRR